MSNQPKHILVIRMSAMGDVAMTVPVLRVLTSTYRGLKITVLTRKMFAPFFEGIHNTTVFEAEIKGSHKGLSGLIKLSKELRALQIDAVADCHDVLRSQVIRRLLKWKSIPFIKIDKGRLEKAALTRRENKIFKQLKPTHQRYADVFGAFGFPIDLKQHEYPAIQSIDQKTADLLDLLYPSYMEHWQWIGIAPFAKHSGKSYPIDLMEEVIAELSNRGYLVFLFGGGDEETKVLQEIDNLYPNVINMAAKIRLTEELRLIHKLSLMISMDSANMHMASLVGTRVISLWGVTHPYAGFYGFDQSAEDAIYPDPQLYPLLPCSIYGNKVYDGYEDCMRSIEPSKVIDRVITILS